jgi:hypothetical protein
MWLWKKRAKERILFQTRNRGELSQATNRLIQAKIQFTIRTDKSGYPSFTTINVRPTDFNAAKQALGKNLSRRRSPSDQLH